MQSMPSFKSVSCSYYREAVKKYPNIRNLENIPEKLCVTLRGSQANEGDPLHNESWITVSNDIILFMSPPELEVGYSLNL